MQIIGLLLQFTLRIAEMLIRAAIQFVAACLSLLAHFIIAMVNRRRLEPKRRRTRP